MSDVLTEVTPEGVMVATLNRPDTLNALTGTMSEDLIEALGQASRDDNVRAVLITGAGRGFCSGADAGAITGGGGNGTPSRYQRLDRMGSSGRLAAAMADCEVPLIAAINGPAAGAGFGIALCCDVRIMGESGRMGSVFIKRGLAADYGASYWLPRIVGVGKAYELFYDGNLLDAQGALEAGLVARVVPDDQLREEALAYAARIAAGPPMAYTGIRRMLMRSTDMPIGEFLEYEWTLQRDLLASEDAREGFRAFLERREPEFKGK